MLNRSRLVPVACLIVFLTAGRHLQAQTAPDASEVTLRSLPGDFLRDEARIWSSPFRADRYNGHVVKKYLIPFVIISAGLIAADRPITDHLPNTHDQLKWSGRVSQIGSAGSLAGLSAGTYLLGRFAKDDHLRETGLLSLEALGHTQIVGFALKELTNRQRPLDGDHRGGFWEGGNSFPSGHASSAFAAATVFAYEYHDHAAVPIVAYSLAGLVSASRLSADKHWVSDVFVGGATGFLLGRFVYKRHHRDEPGTIGQGGLIPHVSLDRTAMNLVWNW